MKYSEIFEKDYPYTRQEIIDKLEEPEAPLSDIRSTDWEEKTQKYFIEKKRFQEEIRPFLLNRRESSFPIYLIPVKIAMNIVDKRLYIWRDPYEKDEEYHHIFNICREFAASSKLVINGFVPFMLSFCELLIFEILVTEKLRSLTFYRDKEILSEKVLKEEIIPYTNILQFTKKIRNGDYEIVK